CSYTEELTLAERPRPKADARTQVGDALVDLPGRR
ncbi:MAG: hypothetical protein QOG56_2209, partial [Solirubrobacteraceae bacterium]|nr:hypothetical protein [Solirubrobacteraceae bacterium]